MKKSPIKNYLAFRFFTDTMTTILELSSNYDDPIRRRLSS